MTADKNNGGLDWQLEVYPLMEKHLSPLDVHIEIWNPQHTKGMTK